ncbi:hypothetical protein KEM55_004920 [Ascosphaera atra]|nr:hypothetical protein KEM55_004920 [Ascosphaera atra]
MNINSWMSDEQVQLIRDGTGSGSSIDEKYRGRPRTRHDEANEAVLRRKSEDYHRLTPAASRAASPFAPHKRDNEQPSTTKWVKETTGQETKTLRTRLAMSSMISYFNDRILTPEMMRAMIILYIGPYNRPDFSSDYFLSPILAPEHLLARFPKTYFLTGERDPLVDDTVIFAGRLRQAKKRAFQQRQEFGLVGEDMEFEDVERQYVQTTLVPGISHGFMQMSGMFPPAWGLIERCAGWIRILYREHSAAAAQTARVTAKGVGARQANRHHSASVSEDEKPLEMARVPQALKMTSRKSANEKKKRKGELKAEEAGTARKGDVKSSNAEDENQITDGAKTDSSKALPAGNGVGPTEPSSAKPTTTPPTTPADELSSTSFDAITPPARNSSSTERRNENERIKAGFPALPTPTREAQMVRLPSEADLMARRMGGLTGGLMGLGEGTRTP